MREICYMFYLAHHDDKKGTLTREQYWHIFGDQVGDGANIPSLAETPKEFMEKVFKAHNIKQPVQ